MRALFVLAVALGSALTFCAQPLAAAAALPTFGGSASVWAATSVFFQSTLLAGYLLVHLGMRWAGPGRQRWVQLGLLALAWTAWAEPSPAWTAEVGTGSAADVWTTLWRRLGLPMLAIAGTTPALSRWFSARTGGDPYPLYAASNVGSLGVLLAYPLVLEPLFGRTLVWWGWWIGFAALGIATAACARDVSPSPEGPGFERTPPHWREGPRWTLWSAVPSALLVADTVYLTTDLAPVPVLWVVPLAAYLSTWVVAFSRHGPRVGRAAMRLLPVSTAVLAPLVLLEVSRPSLVIVAAHVVALAIAGLAFHGALSEDRPHPRGLTAFYGWLAFGGVVGASIPTFVLPALADSMVDLPVAIVLTLAAVRRLPSPGRAELRFIVRAVVVVVALGAWVLLIARGPLRPDGTSVSPALFLPLLAVFALAPARPRAWAWVLASLVALGTIAAEDRRRARVRVRSPYAAHRVVDHDGVRWLAHGRTIHGAVALDEGAAALPYHHRDSPAADVVRDADRPAVDGRPRAIAVVGLGVGALARYASTARVDFIEIDPAVVEIARSEFPFLDECGARCSTIVADGRVAFSRAPLGAPYDAIVLDAFSSDAIPSHLVTREALELYVRHLAPDGVLAVHVTNEHVDLAPMLAAAADHLGLAIRTGAWSRAHAPTGPTTAPVDHRAATRFVVLARDASALARLARASPRWDPTPPPARVRPWTDDRVSLWSVLR